MLSENSEESATFFIITSMLLRSKKDFYSIHIQSCLQSTSWWTPQSNLLSEKKFLLPSLHKLLRGVWEAALKSSVLSRDSHWRWGALISFWTYDKKKPCDWSLCPALRGHHHLGAVSLGLLLWISLSSSSSPQIGEGASGNLLAKTAFLSYMSDLERWENVAHLKLKEKNSHQHRSKSRHEANRRGTMYLASELLRNWALSWELLNQYAVANVSPKPTWVTL